MSFLFPLALLGALLAGVVVLAHALFRGPLAKTEFFALRFVPRFDETTRNERRIDDRWLLLVRVLWILAIALLGAGPFVRCERLGVSGGGDGRGVGVILDDSASMGAEEGRGTRFSLARDAAVELLESLAPTEPVVVVLAGAPPRLLGRSVGPSAELVERVRELTVTDRGTALQTALALARASLDGGAEPRLFVLSDGASPDLGSDEIEATLPLPELGKPRPTCAVDAVRLRGSSIHGEVACSELTLEGRRLELVAVPERAGDGDVLRAPALATHEIREGKLSFPLPTGGARPNWVRLTESKADVLRSDDFAPIANETRLPVALVGVDLARGKTSDAPLVELGLRAVEPELALVRLPSLFSNAESRGYAAVVLEDPAGFSDDESAILEEFVRGGGVALGLFGRGVERASLGRGAFPFFDAPPTVERSATEKVLLGAGVDDVFATWNELGGKNRVRVSVAPEHRTLVRFSDEAPLLVERSLGDGLLLATTVAPDPTQSDFALRPAFLGLLERVVREAQGRRAAEVTSAGLPIPVKGSPRVEPLDTKSPPPRVDDGAVGPDRAGRYRISDARGTRVRIVERPRGETLVPPRALRASGPAEASRVLVPVDLARPLAIFALFLGFGELLARTLLRRRRSRAAVPSPEPEASAMGEVR